MAEPTINCPKCGAEIKLTESLAAPLIESTRKQFQEQLAQKDSDIAAKEKAIREKQKQVSEAQSMLEEQVADQVEEQLKKDRARIAAEEAKKAKLAAAGDLDQKTQELAELQEVLQQRNEKLAEAQKAQAELIKKQRELDDAKREMELTIETRIQAGLEITRDQARKEAEEALNLKVAERDEKINSMTKQIEDLKRRAEQGSQQLQGEVQELELESLLAAKFPFDNIEPVPKGEFGGDALQRVISPTGQACGTILWESKRTKNWSDGWLTKLRDDQRGSGIGRMKTAMLNHGLEAPAYDLIDGYFRVTLKGPGADLDRLRLPSGTSAGLPPAVEEQLNVRQQQIMAHVLETGAVTSGWCRKEFDVTYNTAYRDLSALVELKLLAQTGKGRSTRYVPRGKGL